MSAPIRRLFLAGFTVLALASTAHAQGRGPVAESGIDGLGDDGQLYQDQNGAFYVRRGDRYLPYTGRPPVVRPVPQAAPAPQAAPVYAPDFDDPTAPPRRAAG
ncbi:L,D-transpeptidase, partial [Methylobacterium sp. WL18]